MWLGESALSNVSPDSSPAHNIETWCNRVAADLTHPARLGRRFARALITNTLEGQTLFRDAFHMLGISTGKTFHELGRALEVLP